MTSAPQSEAVSVVHAVRLPSARVVTSLGDDVMMTSQLELACKLTCNVLSTCAYVQCGKVYGNFMIDLAVRSDNAHPPSATVHHAPISWV